MSHPDVAEAAVIGQVQRQVGREPAGDSCAHSRRPDRSRGAQLLSGQDGRVQAAQSGGVHRRDTEKPQRQDSQTGAARAVSSGCAGVIRRLRRSGRKACAGLGRKAASGRFWPLLQHYFFIQPQRNFAEHLVSRLRYHDVLGRDVGRRESSAAEYFQSRWRIRRRHGRANLPPRRFARRRCWLPAAGWLSGRAKCVRHSGPEPMLPLRWRAYTPVLMLRRPLPVPDLFVLTPGWPGCVLLPVGVFSFANSVNASIARCAMPTLTLATPRASKPRVGNR